MADSFTERLRQAVTAAGSIQRLAERSGIAARTISGYLAGKGVPSRKWVVALAKLPVYPRNGWRPAMAAHASPYLWHRPTTLADHRRFRTATPRFRRWIWTRNAM